MKPTKDTALSAMKRAARAVLKDELKALRAELKEAKAEAATVRAECTMKLHEVNNVSQRLRQQHDTMRTALVEFTRRSGQVRQWAEENRKGDLGFRACSEYVQYGPAGEPSAARAGIRVNPFDRWQVTPALR